MAFLTRSLGGLDAPEQHGDRIAAASLGNGTQYLAATERNECGLSSRKNILLRV